MSVGHEGMSFITGQIDVWRGRHNRHRYDRTIFQMFKTFNLPVICYIEE